MTIFRVKKNSNFVVMDKTALHDNRLSWKAKGIIAYMLSMPDDWVFYMSELITHSSDGEKSFRSGLNELKKHGYVKRKPVYENNKIVKWETIIVENPALSLEPPLLAQNVHVGNVHVGNVHVGNEVLLNNNSTNNNKTKNDLNIIPFKEIVEYLNEKTGRSFRYTTNSTKNIIKARWKEGFTLNDFKKVIDTKVSHWLNDEKMNQYLVPNTLFGNKFESYLNQKPIINKSSDLENEFDKWVNEIG